MQVPAPQPIPLEPDPANGAAASPKSRMHGDDRRKQLLRVAIETFSRHGFGGTKTKDIAAAAGVSEAILFRHFATKEDLYHAILDEKEIEDSLEAEIPRIEELMKKRDDAGVLRTIGTHIVRAFQQDPAFHRLIMYASLEGHMMATMFRERMASKRSDVFRRYILQRQKEGAFRKADPEMMHMAAVGLFVHYAMGRYVFGIQGPGRTQQRSDESLVEEIISIVLNGLTGNLTEAGEERRIINNKENIHLEKKTRKDSNAKL